MSGISRTFMPGRMRRSCGLLEVGDDVELVGQRRDGDQLLAGRDVLAEFGGAIAGDAVERRADHGVGHIVLGQLDRGGGILRLGLGLR